MKLKLTALLLLLISAPTAEAQNAPKRQPRVAAPAKKAAVPAVKPKEAPLAPAVTAALRIGYNAPSSELSGGFIADAEAGYRFGMGEWAIEPAIGFQRWTGDRSGSITSSALASTASYEQTATLMVLEGRARFWFDLGEAGFPLLGVGLGGLSADTEQQSFGVTRDESDGYFTWAVHAGWAYPIPAALGNVELLLGYRGANVDFATTGNANTSGFQALLGWHANF